MNRAEEANNNNARLGGVSVAGQLQSGKSKLKSENSRSDPERDARDVGRQSVDLLSSVECVWYSVQIFKYAGSVSSREPSSVPVRINEHVGIDEPEENFRETPH